MLAEPMNYNGRSPMANGATMKLPRFSLRWLVVMVGLVAALWVNGQQATHQLSEMRAKRILGQKGLQ